MQNGGKVNEQEKETGRLEAFSDGVFAIAITLLVLELKVPSLGDIGSGVTSATLGAALAKAWPSYIAFVTSFFTILTMWVHHHIIFRLVRRSDSMLLYANGFMLLLITAVPFPTAVLAQYLRTPAAPMACTFYAGLFVLISISFRLVLSSVLRKGVVSPNASAATLERLRRNYRLGSPLYILATVTAPWLPWLSLAICTGLWIFWAVVTRDCSQTAEGKH